MPSWLLVDCSNFYLAFLVPAILVTVFAVILIEMGKIKAPPLAKRGEPIEKEPALQLEGRDAETKIKLRRFGIVFSILIFLSLLTIASTPTDFESAIDYTFHVLYRYCVGNY